MIGALTLVTSLVLHPNPVWRSVGSYPNALADGTTGNVLTVTQTDTYTTTATFTVPLPDQVGVGDVIQYDTNGDGVVDSLAFIVHRNSSMSYDVHDTTTDLAPLVTATTQWSLFRAYLSLAAAVNTAQRAGLDMGGTENPAIDSALRNFDQFDGGKDLPGVGHRWMVACYDDGTPDDTLVYIGAPWTTDGLHRMEIWTPVGPEEVGVSQRHDGTWGTGYRRTQAIHIVDRDVYLTGLSIQQARWLGVPTDPNYDNRVYLVHTGHKGSDIELSYCYGEQALVDPSAYGRSYDILDDDTPYGSLQTTVRLWNDIGVTMSNGNGSNSAAFFNNTSDDLYVYNCTGVAPNGAYAFLSGNDLGAVKANVVVNGLGWSDGGLAVGLINGSPPQLFSYTAVSDTSLDGTVTTTPDAGNVLGQTFSFVGPADFHLTAADMGARGLGANLVGDPIISFTDDIDGHPRTPPWDVGAVQFFVPISPTTFTSPAIPLWPDSAILQGGVYPNYSATRAWFRYADASSAPGTCDDSFGTRVPTTGSIAAGQDGNPHDFAFTIGGLTPDASYAYCTIASNVAGTAFGDMQVFTVVPDAGTPDAGEDGGVDGGTPDGGAGGGGGGSGGGAGGGNEVSKRLLLVGCGCNQLEPLSFGLLSLLALGLRRTRRSR